MKLAQDKIGKIITYINRRLVIFLRNGNFKKMTVKINLGPNYITEELYQTLEDLTPIPFRLFKKQMRKPFLTQSMKLVLIILIPKPDKDITGKENYT